MGRGQTIIFGLVCHSHSSFTNPYFIKELFNFFGGVAFSFLKKSDERFDRNQIYRNDTEAELNKEG